MDGHDVLQKKYDQNALSYDQFLTIPLGKLEQELFGLCIKDCHEMKVLDLGCGTGARARDALRAGAIAVDAIDISPEMMRQGQDYEKSIGRNTITWIHGDVSKNLDHLLRDRAPYDLVIANGIFDHAHSVAELEAMWANCAAYLKPGGIVIANRNNPYSKVANTGKYGVVLGDFQRFEEGAVYKYRMATVPPLEFTSIALDDYSNGAWTVPGKFFDNSEIVPWSETPVVKSDPDFWKAYLNDPILYIFSAKLKDF